MFSRSALSGFDLAVQRPSPCQRSVPDCESIRQHRAPGYISPEEHFVTWPNQDVVYGFAYADLDREPIVFQVPDFRDRFWVYALYDARTDEFSEVGKQYGTKPGFYLMVGPNWKGETPAGITAPALRPLAPVNSRAAFCETVRVFHDRQVRLFGGFGGGPWRAVHREGHFCY
jgi:hypothetical protein